MTELTTSYGCTEMSGSITLTSLQDEPLQRIRTVGKPLPNVEVAIMDGEGCVLPVGEQGEVWVRGFGVMLGYFDEPGETAKTISSNGWYHSG